jgi:tetratricopeptide (TPR) repeat protein
MFSRSFSRLVSVVPLFGLTFALANPLRAQVQEATIAESLRTFRTYPFSDPDPVARMGNIYPYFRFQGYSMTPVDRSWNVITLENQWIRVLIAPEIGGKILGAFEKSTGRAFIYFNRVIKFREIAMRGPWTSGGIEFNFGDIGHTPTTSNPVDYMTRTNPDGSVSCIVGALDLPSRTEWRVEIRLPRDKAMFETRSFWYNPTPTSTSLYHWMNAAADADSTLQVIYPGTAFIGHGGEVSPWPVDRQGRDLTWYRNNAFGSYKSYHVLGSYTDYFGARWNDFGVIHWSRYTDKPGKKLWIWGLSREGEIWKGLLTDSALGNTQYVELQSGLHFNQAVMQSSRTPFKHMAFLPQTSEAFTEAWLPFRGLGGVTRATPDGVLEVRRATGKLSFSFCPTGKFRENISVVAAGKKGYMRAVELEPLQVFRDSLGFPGPGDSFEMHIGSLLRYRSTDDVMQSLERPLEGAAAFNWKSAYGLVVDARERVRQRDVEGALAAYRSALKVDPTLLPALAGAAELSIRKMEFDSALAYVKHGLSFDAYDPEINYLYGLVQRYRKRPFDARDGFGIASRSQTYRTAAYLQLAEMAFVDSQWTDAADFALRASQADARNVPSLQLLAVLARAAGDTSAAKTHLQHILDLDPLNHFARFELYMLAPTERNRVAFTGMIRNELPHESFLELAASYQRLGLTEDAGTVLSLAPGHPMVDFWRASVAAKAGRDGESRQHLARALSANPSFMFPHRQEDRAVLLQASERVPHWKTSYYLALLSWSLGRTSEAETFFAACGDEPDFAPFYITRAGFRAVDSQRALTDYKRALTVGPEQWRTYNALVTFLNGRGRYREALQVSTQAVERFPDSYVLKFLYARTLLFNEKYRESHALLDTLAILPFEGARYGRDAYREACVMSALDTLRRDHQAAALALVAQARAWPERLGAGRPYDADDRLENFLESRIRLQQGDRQASVRLVASVNAYTAAHTATNSAQHLIGALALRESGRGAEALGLLQAWNRRDPESAFAKWALAMFQKRHVQAESVFRGMQDTALNRSTGDQESLLVADVVKAMGW